ncbi:putative hemolysin [Kaistia hirudinis]|uniref:Putative hemolysin n=1 Tax=Kaistia hirudinis TaxID=1293440 RepID=A0A840AKE4_9HYPH|nr:hemolysin family protein [Kaistia hirudinis]MBB3929634.1 putative hemolysin [Kaistia hirudinis]MBN9018316.1 HlyC/CorC family transporter [Hyphomicrobiales bacterium]
MIWADLLIIAALIAFNAFFALSEIAVVSARPARLQGMANDNVRGAAAAVRLAEDPTGFLSAVQIGITLVAILSGAFGEAQLADPLRAFLLEVFPSLGRNANTIATVVVVFGLAYFSLICGELVPKRLALTNPERVACFVAGPVGLVARVAAPIVWFLRLSTEAILRLLGRSVNDERAVTEEEVKTMIAEGTEAGVFHQAEREMIEGVIRVADRSVRSIMVARPDVVWIDSDDPPDEVFRTIVDSGHSRFPVSRGEVDAVLGIVHAKDLFQQMRSGVPIDLAPAIREPLYVDERMPILRMLDRFKTSNVHMAIVLDEYGSFQGVVTPMDILTAIAGDMPERAEDEEPDAIQRDDGSWLIDGSAPIDVVERTLGLKAMTQDDDFATVAGFMLHHFGHIPDPGESFAYEGWRFEVVDLDGRRIDKVLAERLEPIPVS